MELEPCATPLLTGAAPVAFSFSCGAVFVKLMLSGNLAYSAFGCEYPQPNSL